MKAFYIETNAYNAILIVSDGKFISYNDTISGMDINRENISKIAKSFEEYGYDSNDFSTQYEYGQDFKTLVMGEYDDLDKFLEECEYSEEIYSAE